MRACLPCCTSSAKAVRRLRSFHEKDPTLEDVFMLVTKGLVI